MVSTLTDYLVSERNIRLSGNSTKLLYKITMHESGSEDLYILVIHFVGYAQIVDTLDSSHYGLIAKYDFDFCVDYSVSVFRVSK